MTREEILGLMDNLFHMYESNFRNDAREEAESMIDAFESRTCENCKLLTDKFIPNTLTCRAGFNPECGGCNKWESI